MMIKEVTYICDWSAGTEPLDATLIIDLLNAKVDIKLDGLTVQQQLTLDGRPVNAQAFGFVFNTDAIAQIKKDHPSYDALQKVLAWDYVLPKEHSVLDSDEDLFSSKAMDSTPNAKTIH